MTDAISYWRSNNWVWVLQPLLYHGSSLPDDYSSIQNIVFNAATLTQIKKQKFPQWIGTVCYAALLLSMNGGGRVVWDAHTQKNTYKRWLQACNKKWVPFKEGPTTENGVCIDETQFPAQKFHLLLFCQDFYSEAQEMTLQMSTNAYVILVIRLYRYT